MGVGPCISQAERPSRADVCGKRSAQSNRSIAACKGGDLLLRLEIEAAQQRVGVSLIPTRVHRGNKLHVPGLCACARRFHARSCTIVVPRRATLSRWPAISCSKTDRSMKFEKRGSYRADWQVHRSRWDDCRIAESLFPNALSLQLQ